LKLRIQNQTVDMNTIVVDRADGTLGPNVKVWDGTCMSGKPTVEDDPARLLPSGSSRSRARNPCGQLGLRR
jgi:hypothetical protein